MKIAVLFFIFSLTAAAQKPDSVIIYPDSVVSADSVISTDTLKINDSTDFLRKDSLSDRRSLEDSIEVIEEHLKSFRYSEVIKTSEVILNDTSLLPREKININLMKGISHFVLRQDTLAKYSFMDILKIDPLYNPDSVIVPPKIIFFFSEVKKEFYSLVQASQHKDTVIMNQKVFNDSDFYNFRQRYRTSVVRSLLFPGLGHIYNDNKKGWFLAGAGAASLISSVYFIFNTERNKSDYLSARNPADIKVKYDAYNTSYILKNVSLFVFGAVWVFSQADLLFNVLDDLEMPTNIIVIPTKTGGQLAVKLSF